MNEAPSLFDQGCEDEQHTWSEPVRAETSAGVLTARVCVICGLNHTKLTQGDS